MQRVVLAEPPMLRLAVWSKRLGWFAVTVTLLSVLVVRSDILEVQPALVTFAAALGCAALVIFLALNSFVIIWKKGCKGLSHAIIAILLGLALLAYPSYLAFLGSKLPMINDITTDPANPPQFTVLAHLRPHGSNDYPGAKAAALQKSAYPDIVPLQLDVKPLVAYNMALKAIAKRNWHVVNARPPELQHDGFIEVVAHTPIMRLRHDVVVRLDASNNGTRVDVRSASRFGVSDFGTNAKRVRALLDDIDDAADSMPETVAEPEKKPVVRR
jgi:uncharacterized protein (DUF1499 family)